MKKINIQKKLNKGFTLIEMMVVVSIAAILLGIGIPSFRNLIQNQQITSAVNDFFAAINLTRSEAIQRGARVDLVPVGDGSDWAKGWVVFVDKNNNQKLDEDEGEQIIYMHGPVASGITIVPNFTDDKANYLAYNGTGRTRTNGSGEKPDSGNFMFSLGDDQKQQRRIIINMLGRPQVCNPATDGSNCKSDT